MSRQASKSKSDQQAVLIFPPLVETSFGSYFPSTAVLAAYLESRGISTLQLDLNAAFAAFLLEPEQLEDVERRAGPASAAAAAARWLRRNRHLLFDAEGRGAFDPESTYGPLLQSVARIHLSDPTTEALNSSPAALRSEAYDRFFDHCELDGLLPPAPALIGLTIPMGPQLVPSLLLAAEIEALRPAARVIIGGPAVSLMDADDLAMLLASHRAVDAAVKFDGEAPLLALALQAIGDRWQPERVAGVSALVGSEVKHRLPGAGPKVDALPIPVYDERILEKVANPSLAIVQARGCYWGRCDYCDFIELYDGSPPFRTRTADSFVDELGIQVDRYGVDRFTFITESIPPAFARRISRKLLERELEISWESFAMVDRRFDRELLELMVEAGCECLVIGMETTITRVLRLVHKSADRDENFRFLREASDAGMKLRVNVIPDLPSTTYAEALSALADCERLADCVESYAIFPFEATRSSNVGRNPSQFGLVSDAADLDGGQSQYTLNHLGNADPAMSPAERAEVHSRFSQLAQEVNLRRSAGTREGLGLEADSMVRLDVTHLDTIAEGRETVVNHVTSGTRMRLANPLADQHAGWLTGSPFRVADLRRALGAASRPEAVDDLLRVGLIERAQGDYASAR